MKGFYRHKMGGDKKYLTLMSKEGYSPRSRNFINMVNFCKTFYFKIYLYSQDRKLKSIKTEAVQLTCDVQ